MASRSNSRLAADLSLVVLTSVWGATFLVVKDALGDADPMSFLAVRFALGGVVTTALGARALRTPGIWGAGALLGLFLFLGFGLQTEGLLSTTASRSAFITGLSVVLVPFVSVVLLRRWPSPPALVGVTLAVVGLAWLTGALSGAADRAHVKGDVLTALCALSFSVHITLTERYAARYPAAALVAVQLWTVSLLSAASVPFGPVHLIWTRALWVALLFCGLLASAVALVVQTWAQARTTAVRAALIYSLEPVFAALYSVALGRERLGTREVGGGALIVVGVLTAEVGGALWRKRARARA